MLTPEIKDKLLAILERTNKLLEVMDKKECLIEDYSMLAYLMREHTAYVQEDILPVPYISEVIVESALRTYDTILQDLQKIVKLQEYYQFSLQ